MKIAKACSPPSVRNPGMRYPRPRLRAKIGFSCQKMVKCLWFYDWMLNNRALSCYKAYSQILEFIQIHDFLEEVKFYFFKYSFE